MEINYITLGSDCRSALALRDLQLRNFALPFDWLVIQSHQLCSVILHNFEGYHDNLILNQTQMRVVDGYGIEFPHDYSTNVQDDVKEGEEFIHESIIKPGWETHVSIVQEKYKRRIERFHAILNSDKPIIALFTGDPWDVPAIRYAFAARYNKTNIIFVVATYHTYSDPFVVTCNVEENGVWNDSNVWNEGIQRAKDILNTIL